MCGPFVLAQAGETMAKLEVGSGELRRLAGAARPPYHAGRAVTYILLAVLLSLPLHLMSQLPQLRFVPAMALALGAALFLVLGSTACAARSKAEYRALAPAPGSVA